MIKDDFSDDKFSNPPRTSNTSDSFKPLMEVSLDEKEFELFQTKKNKKFFTESIRSLIILLLYIISSSLSTLLLQYNLPHPKPFVSAYFNTAIFIVYIPISFIVNLYSEIVKNPPQEEEKTSLETQKKMSDNFSDIIEKKFYENYYRYYRRFYVNYFVSGITNSIMMWIDSGMKENEDKLIAHLDIVVKGFLDDVVINYKKK